MQKILIALIAIIIIGLGVSFIKPDVFSMFMGTSEEIPLNNVAPVSDTLPTPVAVEKKEMEIIGTSVEGRDIVAYHYGSGPKEVLIVGGIHGGYEWNASLTAFEAITLFKTNPSVIPATVSVTVIPLLNPDGLHKVAGTTENFTAKDINPSKAVQESGRFNANKVDLNRNFDCDWKPEGMWQNKKVSGGSSAFSEPESKAIQAYIAAHKPAAAIVMYSAAGGVYASSCGGSVSTETRSLLTTYADASGYKAHETFDSYEITGDMVNWFAKQNIPAISVLLTNHTDTDWAKNQAGIQAVLNSFAK